MVLEVQRLVKDGKIESLFYVENSILYIYKDKEVELKTGVTDTEVFLYIENYCQENSCKKLKSILMEKEDMKDFFIEVNKKRVIKPL